jgi:GxxExxY protein
MKQEDLTYDIINCAYKVHNTLGTGFLEKVYENAMHLELNKQGLKTEQQVPIQVYYDGQVIGEYYADLFIEEKIIVELKAVQKLVAIHEVQLVNYLTATGIDIGLLINFGTSVEVKRKHRVYKPK